MNEHIWQRCRLSKEKIDGGQSRNIRNGHSNDTRRTAAAPLSPERLARMSKETCHSHANGKCTWKNLHNQPCPRMHGPRTSAAARMGCHSWSRQNDVLMEAHALLGHRNWADTAACCRQQGFKLGSVATAFCDVCLRVKTTRNEASRTRATEDESDLLTRWHVDVSGPHEASRLGGMKRATVFCSKGGTALVHHFPDMLNFTNVQSKFIADVSKLLSDFPDHPPIDIHAVSWRDGVHVTADGAKCFTSNAAKAFWQDHRIHVHTSAPLCPALNGAAERVIKTLGHAARCSLLFRDQPDNMWPEAWQMAALVHDFLPTGSDPDGRRLTDCHHRSAWDGCGQPLW